MSKMDDTENKRPAPSVTPGPGATVAHGPAPGGAPLKRHKLGGQLDGTAAPAMQQGCDSDSDSGSDEELMKCLRGETVGPDAPPATAPTVVVDKGGVAGAGSVGQQGGAAAEEQQGTAEEQQGTQGVAAGGSDGHGGGHEVVPTEVQQVEQEQQGDGQDPQTATSLIVEGAAVPEWLLGILDRSFNFSTEEVRRMSYVPSVDYHASV
jgi:hypothetical protein